MIRPCTIDDADAICTIYNSYIEKTIISFEIVPVTTVEMKKRISSITASFPWLVWEANGKLLGYAYGSPWKARAAYSKTVETTVYLADGAKRQGIGAKLYEALLQSLQMTDYHMAVAGISLPNPASIALHEKMGFKKVAHFPAVGRKFDQWIDVGCWARAL